MRSLADSVIRGKRIFYDGYQCALALIYLHIEDNKIEFRTEWKTRAGKISLVKAYKQLVKEGKGIDPK